MPDSDGVERFERGYRQAEYLRSVVQSLERFPRPTISKRVLNAFMVTMATNPDHRAIGEAAMSVINEDWNTPRVPVPDIIYLLTKTAKVIQSDNGSVGPIPTLDLRDRKKN